jgi:hypothetical protein
MQKLLDYLDTGKIGDEQLYAHFCRLSKNKILKSQLAKPAQKTHLRYQLSKLLSAEDLAKYKDLLLPSAKKEAKNNAIKVKTEPIAPKTEFIPQSPYPSVLDNEIRRLTNAANVLANTLGDFVDNDNEGRAQKMAQIFETEEQIKEARNGAKPAKEVNPNFDFEKTKSEIEKMNDAEKRDYKALLARRKNRAKTSLEEKPNDKNVLKWQSIFDKCQELQTLVG